MDCNVEFSVNLAFQTDPHTRSLYKTHIPTESDKSIAPLNAKGRRQEPPSFFLHLFLYTTAASTDWIGGRKSASKSQLSPESRL